MVYLVSNGWNPQCNGSQPSAISAISIRQGEEVCVECLNLARLKTCDVSTSERIRRPRLINRYPRTFLCLLLRSAGSGPSRKPFRDRAKTVRLPTGIAVRLQPGILFVLPRVSEATNHRAPAALFVESASDDPSILIPAGKSPKDRRSV